jgi:predicted N-acetyltransferase YhbS
MSTSTDYSTIVARPPDPVPAGAEDLFGDEVVDAWAREVAGAPEPVCICVAGEDGELLAGVYLHIERDAAAGADAKVASVRQLIVKPEHRGRGLAGRLLRRATSAAVEAGCARIRSTAGWGCPDHLGIYHRLGYDRAAPAERPYLVTRTTAR